jgi:hypothetical protein
MPVTINASTSTGLVQTADTSGEIELQSNGTTALKVNTNEGIQILNCLGVGNATPSTSGAGITFPATQSASSDANTLDDYEEGTWTPVPRIGGSALTVSGSNIGTYTKIGRVVYIQATITNIAKSGSGNLSISGLPFTIAANPDVQGTVRWDGINTTGLIYAYFSAGGTTISMQEFKATGGYDGEINNADIPGSAFNYYGISGFYFV